MNTKFYISPLKRLEFDLKIQSEMEFALCFTNDITDKFNEELETTDNVVIWIYGRTGIGKSSVAISLAHKKDVSEKGFHAKLICFDNLGIKEVVANSQRGNSFIRDETVKDFGEGSGQLLSTIQDLTETLRKRRNSFFLLSPVIKGVSFVHYYLEVLQSSVSLEEKSIANHIENGLQSIEFRVGVQNNQGRYLGFIVVSVPVNNPTWNDYQAEKDKFLELIASGERTSGLDIEAEAKRFKEMIDFKKYARKGERLNFIKMNSNYTLGQCKSISLEMEILIRQEVEESGQNFEQNCMEAKPKRFIPSGFG